MIKNIATVCLLMNLGFPIRAQTRINLSDWGIEANGEKNIILILKKIFKTHAYNGIFKLAFQKEKYLVSFLFSFLYF
ncbi:hypothetical protein QFZ20_000274 [Flavobacterium sp. W4I14]|nr:hypothetical protein [Flavobacterium sp. W4I14]